MNNASSPATMEDVANLSGVSKMTISRVFSQANGVSPKTKERVLKAASALGYEYNSLAANLTKDRTSLVGLATPFEGLLGSPYFSNFVMGAQSVFANCDYAITLYNSLSDNFNDGKKLVRLIRQRRVDGLLVLAPHEDDPYLRTLSDLEMPLVVVGGRPKTKGIAWVDVDHVGGIQEVMDYLYELGHRDFGFLAGPEYLSDANRRENAFRSYLEKKGLITNETWIRRGEYEHLIARNAAKKILSSPSKPTAIVAANDLMALGVLDAAHLLGLKVPEDISITGFDDSPIASETLPQLTTVRQPTRKLGNEAASLLMDQLSDSVKQSPKHCVFSTELIIRKSTDSPSQHRIINE